jgi:hypothetical protein
MLKEVGWIGEYAVGECQLVAGAIHDRKARESEAEA